MLVLIGIKKRTVDKGEVEEGYAHPIGKCVAKHGSRLNSGHSSSESLGPF